MDVLADAAREISGWTPGADTRFTRYRGDGWQMHLAEPGLALRAALVLAARLRAADTGLATRAAIGIGRIEDLGTASLADARGPAFEASGHALDRMRYGRRLAIDGEGVTHACTGSSWSSSTNGPSTGPPNRPKRRRSTCIRTTRRSPTSPRGSRSRPQAVNYRLSRAGAPAIRRALRAWEDDWEFAGEDRGKRRMTAHRVAAAISRRTPAGTGRCLKPPSPSRSATSSPTSLLQTDAMVREKTRPEVLLLHVAIVAAASWAALGFAIQPLLLLLIAASHFAIDWAKLRYNQPDLRPLRHRPGRAPGDDRARRRALPRRLRLRPLGPRSPPARSPPGSPTSPRPWRSAPASSPPSGPAATRSGR